MPTMKNLLHFALLISCSVCVADGPKRVGDIDPTLSEGSAMHPRWNNGAVRVPSEAVGPES